jgi:heterodisulfide reductase subunit A
MEASAAAARAMALLAKAKGTLVTEKRYPPEKDVSEQEPRIGAFICHCGKNIAGVVDVTEVVDYARELPNVVYAEDSLYTCSTDSCEHIKEIIEEHDLNRVIVSSCTPRTHEPLFQDTIRQTGLNPYLFEMANIRDQCSWVHMHEPEKATTKAKNLVRMAAAKANLLHPLHPTLVDVNRRTLVVGGGLAGMTAALELAGQGFETVLVEKSEALGGNLRHLHYTLHENHVQEYLAQLIEEVERSPRIHIYKGARVELMSGSLGDFTTEICTANGESVRVECGAIIVATGAQEHRTVKYLYGQDDRVLTQRDLEERLAKHATESSEERNSNDFDDLSSVVMIQCVSSRDDERPYCSRICCSQALKNALKLKDINPKTEVIVLYRDLMSYGLREESYTRAREAGVKFLRYDAAEAPEVVFDANGNSKLQVSVVEADLRRKLDLPADLVVLSVPTVAPMENSDLAKILKVPLDADGFFLEAHMKLRPVDFSADGIFMCGLAHGPKFMEETIIQSQAAAARVASTLAQPRIESQAMVPIIDLEKCIGCRVCESICAYQAIMVEETASGKKARVRLAACKGCGSCSAACPQLANNLGYFTDPQLLAQIRAFGEVPRFSANGFEPKILGFLCNWCAYAGADLAGVSRIPYQPNFHTMRVMCTGRIDPSFIIEAFLQGIDGVMVLGCHSGDCHYTVGNLYARDRMAYLERVMEQVGLDSQRFKLDWVSASEGARFAEVVNTFTDQVRALGPIS